MSAQPIDPAARGPWGPDPVRQRLAVHAYDLVDGAYELAAASAEELALAKPFELRLRVRDIAP